MRFKTTMKEVKATNRVILKVGYCNLATLLRYESPYAYTTGAYGWNADVYAVNDVAIVTGYRPFGQNLDCDLVEKFEERARALVDELDKLNKYDGDFKQGKMRELIEEFIKEATK